MNWRAVYVTFILWLALFIADGCGLFEAIGEWVRQRKIRKAMKGGDE